MNNNIKITYPNSDKVYLNGNIYPELRVAMRRVRPNFCAARISHSLKECKEQ
jgi:hypothetical protein